MPVHMAAADERPLRITMSSAVSSGSSMAHVERAISFFFENFFVPAFVRARKFSPEPQFVAKVYRYNCQQQIGY